MPLSLSVLNVAIVVLLVVSSAVLGIGSSFPIRSQDACVTYDQPNQIADLYPDSATGTLNATLLVIPVPLAAARGVIPSQYPILEQVLRTTLPEFPEGMYPVLLQAAHDHDIQVQAYNLSVPDFSRVGFEFPFLDLLGDGHSPFRWAPAQLLSSTNSIAIAGSEAYGTAVVPASFDPACNAYAPLPGRADGATFFKAWSTADPSTAFVDIEVSPAAESHAQPGTSPTYPTALFEALLAQPIFANGSSCDRMARLFNATMAQARTAVEGSIRARVAPFDGVREWSGVSGLQVATPFVEDNYLDCQSLGN